METIGAVLDEFQANGGDILRLSETDKATLKRRIDESYPFGERGKFPYKAWLDVRRKTFNSLGIAKDKKIGCDHPVEDQLDLKF